jgi:hypothetical protein
VKHQTEPRTAHASAASGPLLLSLPGYFPSARGRRHRALCEIPRSLPPSLTTLLLPRISKIATGRGIRATSINHPRLRVVRTIRGEVPAGEVPAAHD